MTTHKRLAFVGIALVVVMTAAVVIGLAVRRDIRYGAVLDQPTSTVDVGARFSVRVPDRGASVGDHWTVSVEPDDAVALVEDELVSDGLGDRIFGPAIGGGGGNRYFLFDAKRAGQVTITLTNCFQGCQNERTRAESKTVTWTVSIS